MDTAMLFVALGNLVFALVCVVVAVRVLALARRTRQAPELFGGIALGAIALTIPAIVLGGVGRTTVGELIWPLVVVGFVLLQVASVALFAFTWKTFRPDAGWAKALVVVASAAQLAIIVGAFRALAGAPAETPSGAAAATWMLATRGPLTVSFAWTMIEAFYAWSMARRRMALGLGDAVATNRMLLWAWVGLISTVNNAVGAALQLHGASSTNDPVAAAVMVAGGVSAAVLMWLVFLPPRSYVERIARRAARPA